MRRRSLRGLLKISPQRIFDQNERNRVCTFSKGQSLEKVHLEKELKSAEQIDVLDTPSTFDRMSDMSNLIEDQKTISKALAHLNELREEPKAHKIRAYDENVTRTFARN